MAYPKAIGTRDIPLKLASALTNAVMKEWNDKKSFLDKLTPVTRELIDYWDPSGPYSDRKDNFNIAQWQAILNTVYIHEILKVKNIGQVYKAMKNVFDQF